MADEEKKEKIDKPVDYEQPWDGLDVEQIVSIDFGSFGFAASFCPLGAPSHQRIVQDWSDTRAAAELNKNLAALLIDKETKQTVAMGYEAEELYTKAQEKKEDDKYMYFEHFKPYLYSKDYLEKNIPVPSADGQSTLPLADLITKSLNGVMEHSLDYINGLNTMAGIDNVDKTNVFWVISVPAIWDEMSKEMMKHCAKQAGMKHFELGSEPIVSTFHVLNCQQSGDFRLRPHDKLCILDCGGGTIDAACIEIQSKEYDLSELHHGDGIRCGGLDVDRKFTDLLHELLPKEEIVDVVKSKQPGQWMRQKQEFVLAKFQVPLNLEDAWNVPFCFGINQMLSRRRRRKGDPMYRNIKSKIAEYSIPNYDSQNQKESVTGAFQLGRSNLKIDKKGWLYLHEDVFEKIVTFLRRLLSNAMVSGCNKVIVVGGFANSKYLLHRLTTEFPDRSFFTPSQPHLSVVKGALYWICQRDHIKRTRARYSYGIAIDRRFNPNLDPLVRRKQTTEGAIVENAFNALVVRNEEYEDGYTDTFDYWIPAGADHLEIYLYASEDQFCQYVFNEDGQTLKCFAVKKFVIAIDNPSQQRVKFQIILEYNQNGINLKYHDPNDGELRCVEVDTTIKPAKDCKEKPGLK
eukprot:1112457_1